MIKPINAINNIEYPKLAIILKEISTYIIYKYIGWDEDGRKGYHFFVMRDLVSTVQFSKLPCLANINFIVKCTIINLQYYIIKFSV